MADNVIRIVTYVNINLIDDWYYQAGLNAQKALQKLIPSVSFYLYKDDVRASKGDVFIEYDEYKLEAKVIWECPVTEHTEVSIVGI